LKAAYDPRICGVYLDIDNVDCGWAKLDEIQRQIVNFRKSGRWQWHYNSAFGEFHVTINHSNILLTFVT
jgi:protease-4